MSQSRAAVSLEPFTFGVGTATPHVIAHPAQFRSIHGIRLIGKNRSDCAHILFETDSKQPARRI